MNIFETFPQYEGTMCPICGTNRQGQTVLIPIYGTFEGNMSEVKPTHLECILDNLIYFPKIKTMNLETKQS